MAQTERHTVLILGAGASVPYGFPTGTELVSAIHKEYPSLLRGHVASTDQASSHAEEFCAELDGAGNKSIDTFLEFAEGLRKTGALAIALTMLYRERPGTLSNVNRADPDNWYRELINWLYPSPDVQFPASTVSVITYNYERSLEQYMYTALSDRLKRMQKRPTNAAELMGRVPIIHVHGRFGRLYWQQGDGEPVPYDWERVAKDANLIQSAADNIMIAFNPQIEKSKALQEARDRLSTATHIIFLGFGYDERNIRRLFQPNPIVAGHVHVVGTAFGLNKLEVRDATNMLKTYVVESFVELRPLKNCEFITETGCFR